MTQNALIHFESKWTEFQGGSAENTKTEENITGHQPFPLKKGMKRRTLREKSACLDDRKS